MSNSNVKTVVVGLSGGVDSSVAAFLLKKQGYRVIGLHMKTENPDTAELDKQRVLALAEKLGIEVEFVDYSNSMQIVKDYFISEYKLGRTPNPCVICNREVKFKPFIDYAEKIGADFFATGHYARICRENGEIYLKKATDVQKDQSYFLCQLSRKQLQKALFPLGEIEKNEVKKIAVENELVSGEIRESYDVCFLGDKKFKDFMQENYPENEGNIVNILNNQIVGKHSGISKYTIGQRKGLGIGGGYGKLGECWFVVKKDVKNNIVYVAQGNDNQLYSSALISNSVNWITKTTEKEFTAKAKFRYRQMDQDVRIKLLDNGKVFVEFFEKQRAVTEGQYVVFYNNDVCLGGGTIDEVIS